MRILAVESASGTASAAVMDDDTLRSTCLIQNGLTHSQTLLPLVHQTLSTASIPLKSVDLLAVTLGPGSFTGIRIGLATVKGLAFGSGLPCAGISTLEAIAYNFYGHGDCIVCCVMDARRNQVYTADFLCENGKITRLTADCAISIDALKPQICAYERPVLLAGDGAGLCYEKLKTECANLALAPALLRFQQASGVALCAFENPKKYSVAHEKLIPSYLRLPQAQRELNQRKGETSHDRIG